MKGNTSHGFRKQFLTDEALKNLHKAKELNPNGIYVFEPNGEIMTTDSFNRRLKKYCKEAGVPYHSSHKIRFYNASTAFDGNNLTTLSYLMGIAKRQPHSTIYGTSTRGRMTALLFKNWEFLHKVFKGVQTSGSKKEEKRCKFNISLTFTYCRRPESNRYGYHYPRDFKSRASASSATAAFLKMLSHLERPRRDSNSRPPP